MQFVIDFNNKLVNRMFFYKNFSNETFKFKKFTSNKSLIKKIILEGKFKRKVVLTKKDILKKSIVLQLLSKNKPKFIFNIKKKLQIKEGTMTNVKIEIEDKYNESFIQHWFFLLNPFFMENEIESIVGPLSLKKNFDAFKAIRLERSKFLSSNVFNFDLSIKFFFFEENISDIFFNNYE